MRFAATTLEPLRLGRCAVCECRRDGSSVGAGWLRAALGYERVLRDEFERATTIRYILDNPVKAGLVTRAAEFPYTGSSRYSIAELEAQASASDEAVLPGPRTSG